MSMLTRFQGPTGERNLVEVLKGNRLVEHDEELAKRLAQDGELVQFKPTEKLVEQGGVDRDLYLLLYGDVNVFVNGTYVATRRKGDAVGEMALLDASATRSATLVADSMVVALKVDEPTFYQIANDFPRIYKPIAATLAERLRERARFHRPPNPKPVLFIGCSVEGLPIGTHIQLGLKHDRVKAIVWNQGIFGPSSVTLDVLTKMAEESDYAAFVFGPDDKIISREEAYAAPRDNVVFELGMFITELTRERCLIVKEHGSQLKIPSDLLGITPITYIVEDPSNLTHAVATVCTEIRDVVQRLGVR
jgi:CRP/FNR family transcriptional regulator, cyclic AMP receptor protein